MTKIERKFSQMALSAGISLNSADVNAAINNFVEFLRAAKQLDENVKQELRNFGSDQQRETRQRILSACAGFTPERICHTPANDGITRICSCGIQHCR